jgi:NhaP-type Na+/H+ or K+/H+ antiporter
MENIASIVVLVGVLVFLAHFFTGIFSRTRIPTVLLLIAIGFFFGPVFGLVSPAEFGIVGPVFTTIAIIILLFENGLGVKLTAVRSTLGGVLKLTSLHFLLSMSAVAGLAILLTDLDILPAFILGAILSSTAGTVINSFVDQIKARAETGTLLSMESSISDVLSIIITVSLVQAGSLGNLNILSLSGDLAASFFVALVFGFIGAIIWSALLNRIHAVKNTMFTTPAFVFVLYGLVEMIGFSGPIAAFAFGITIGNIESIRVPLFKGSSPEKYAGFTESERMFFSEVAFILKTFFFIYMGISLELISDRLMIVGVILCVLIFAIRLLTVKASVSKSFPKLDISIVAVMAPKGLTALVLASLPLQQGIAGGQTIVNIVYGVVLVSIVLTSVLVILVEKTKLVDFYGWILSSRFPRLQPKVVDRPDDLYESGETVVPVGSTLFKETIDKVIPPLKKLRKRKK